MEAKRQTRGRPIAIDLFCGAGGMSVGFEQAGFDIALAVDRDGYHSATHERNFPYGATLCRSISDLTLEQIYGSLGGIREVDLVFGGPPCQGFSTMGQRDALDPRNTLVGQFVRIIREVRPKAFVMENVPGMLAGSTRAILDDALAQFESSGYRITRPVRVLDASAFGVPQKRKRLIVLGIRSDCGSEIVYPGPPIQEALDPPTVWEAIADLPKVDEREELFRANDALYDCEPLSDYARIMRGRAVNAGDFSHPRVWDSTRCTGCLRVKHAPHAIALYAATPSGTMVPSHKLPKLDPAGIAPTLRAGSDSSHGSYTAPRPIHPFKPRCITVREAARLHGFPDWFGFYPLKWHGYRQIGNAVCPPLAHALGAAILRALRIRPVKPKRAIELGDEFHLPPERPRSLKRIPQILHFPPVIEKLFLDRFDEANGRLTAPKFSFIDVQKAIASTGVALTWVRSDTFLAEIARSRNVLRLLAPCLRRGFTIQKLGEGKAIGQFVPLGHPDGLEMKSPSKQSVAKIPRKPGVASGQKTLFS